MSSDLSPPILPVIRETAEFLPENTYETTKYKVHSDILAICLEGQRIPNTMTINGKKYKFDPPMAFLYPQWTEENGSISKGKKCIATLFHGKGMITSGEKKNECALNINNQKITVPLVKYVDSAVANEMFRILKMIKEKESATAINQLASVSLLLHAIEIYCRAESRIGRSNIHKQAKHLYLLINENAFEDLTMGDFLKKIPLTNEYLQDIFVKSYGITPGAYRTRLRMEKAKDLIISSGLNVKETAYEVGYNDPHYFSRVFSKTFGISPSKIRNTYGQNINKV